MTEIYRPVLRSKITQHEDASGDTQRFRILYLSCGHWAMTERTNHKRPKQARCRTCEIRGGWEEEGSEVGLRQSDFPDPHDRRKSPDL